MKTLQPYQISTFLDKNLKPGVYYPHSNAHSIDVIAPGHCRHAHGEYFRYIQLPKHVNLMEYISNNHHIFNELLRDKSPTVMFRTLFDIGLDLHRKTTVYNAPGNYAVHNYKDYPFNKALLANRPDVASLILKHQGETEGWENCIHGISNENNRVAIKMKLQIMYDK